jgi:uroporphyrinogen decarboxylase
MLQGKDKVLLKTLSGIKTKRTPIWIMRQAGRFLPEYRALRKKCPDFMAFCFNPDRASEATLLPLHRFDLDAAIIFSDILTIPHALGQKVSFEEGVGPRLADFKSVKVLDQNNCLETLNPVYEAIKLTKKALAPHQALIGFSGAPWTLATYMVEGGPSKDFSKTKLFAFEQPDAFLKLLDILTTEVSQHLIRQIDAGADVVQIFDSWAGAVPNTHFDSWVLAPMKKIVSTVKEQHPNTPIIGFPKGIGSRYKPFAIESGVQGVSIDQSVDLPWVDECFPQNVAIQGAIDPYLLVAGRSSLEDCAKYHLNILKNRPYIVNLSHGVVPETPPEHLTNLINIIRTHDDA